MTGELSKSESSDYCPICTDSFQKYDLLHPIQCPRQCTFNFCLVCVESLLSSTKDDYTEASDGNVFKVFLHCPNCRSNLGPSIRDTLLLRRVDKFKEASSGAGENWSDSELSASELRFKHALENDKDVAGAVQEALRREMEFFGKTPSASSQSTLTTAAPSASNDESMEEASYLDCLSFSATELFWSYDDEEGIEADLDGVHKSFIFRHHSMEDDIDEDETADQSNAKNRNRCSQHRNQRKPRHFLQNSKNTNIKPDKTLLCGLDAFMTKQEQEFITSLLISGDVIKLAAATEMMHYISALSRQGITPSRRFSRSFGKGTIQTTANKATNNNTGRTAGNNILDSIREIIHDANEARRLEMETKKTPVAGGANKHPKATYHPPPREGYGARVSDQKKRMDIEMRNEIKYMELHPLPVRMPKYAELRATSNFALTFLDDTWDGTVLDAFTKITVNQGFLGDISIVKRHAESRGIRNVIEAEQLFSPKSKTKTKNGRDSGDNARGRIANPQPRVIVASMTKEGGQQGIVKGDVVSHFNGEEFVGTKEDLDRILNSRREGETLTFAFNADRAVAEALWRRSLIVD